MLRGPGLLAVGALLGPGCVPEFTCSEDADCDSKPGGVCQVGVCNYDDPAASSSTLGPDSSSTTKPGPTSDATDPAATDPGPSSDTDPTGDTDAPSICAEYDRLVPDSPGKATGVALLPGEEVVVVGITDLGPSRVLVKHLDAAGEPLWTGVLADTDNQSEVNERDLWARVFVSGPDEALVAYSLRTLEMDVSVRSAAYVQTVDLAGHTVAPARDELSLDYRSLRAAAMPTSGELLLAGERKDNLWYQRATIADVTWTPAWPEVPALFAPDAAYYDPATAQAITAIAGAVLVGGTWDTDVGQMTGDYKAWLRRVDPANGAIACACEFPSGTGILALAPAADGDLRMAGFSHDIAQSYLWLARVDPTCPLDCSEPGSSLKWDIGVPGDDVDDYSSRAEFIRDAAFAIHPLADGGVIVGGQVDEAPWAARYSASGMKTWELDDSAGVPRGAALALAVTGDDRCLTIVGSEHYLVHGDRTWWARRVQLPN